NAAHLELAMFRLLLLLPMVCFLLGCGRGQAQIAQSEALVVPVAQPVQRLVADYVDYTGRTNAVNNVAVQARVTGYLLELPFKEGDYVKKGDILFKIDPRQYEAQYKAALSQYHAAQSQLAANRAKLKYDVATNKRFKELGREKKGAVAERELD